ncbi:MAG: hypothetical protein GQ574_09410 [Crocinitomix sp.]|nr:hypothetical protein [Crocinitomix sp.]
MTRFYKRLYQFDFNHTFYTDRETSDFSMTAFSETVAQLRTNGLLLKTRDTGFDLVYQKLTDVGNLPLIAITSSEKLMFKIEVSNPDILNVTDLGTKTNATDIYNCQGKFSDPLALSTIATRQPNFTEEYTYTFDKITFKIEDVDGDIIYEEVQTGTQDPDVPTNYNFSFSVNLSSGFKQDYYTLKTYRNGVQEDALDVYLFNRLSYPNLVGIFELELDATLDYSLVPYQAVLTLNALATKWAYQIELTRDFTGGIMNVVDNSSTVVFTEDLPTPVYGIGETVGFTSTTEITKTEKAIADFKLVVTSPGLDVTLEKLPNPTHNNLNSIVYLKI